MTDLKDKKVLVYDHGSFTAFAQRLTDFFGVVGYFSPWQSAFPRRGDACPGEGVPGIERVYDFWDAAGDADLIAFPDSYDGDLVDYLRSLGRRVWGSGQAAFLELDRLRSRALQTAAGLATPPSKRVVGLPALRKMVKKKKEFWVKVSLWRDDFETFHHTKEFTTTPFLDMLQEKYGPLSETVEFVVEESVPGTEIGWDCHTVNGLFPRLGMMGLEAKDRGLLGALVPFDGLPEEARNVYAAMSPTLAEGKYANYFTVEIRAEAAGSYYPIDVCCRLGSPAAEAWMEMVGNLGEVVWEGGGGRLVEVVPTHNFAALAVINSPWALKHWTPIDVPASSRRWVKIKNLTVVAGRHYYAPGRSEMAEVGVVVGLGDSWAEAIAECRRHAEAVAGYNLTVQTESLEDSMESVEGAKELGVRFPEESSGDTA